MPVSAMRRQFPTVNLMLSAVKRREVRIWRASTGLPRREREGRFSQLCEKPLLTHGQKDTLEGCILRILSVPPPFPLRSPSVPPPYTHARGCLAGGRILNTERIGGEGGALL